MIDENDEIDEHNEENEVHDTDEVGAEESETDLEELDGIVKTEDGRLRAKMAVNANGGRVPDDYC